MAISSITHNFVVSDPERFIEAFEASERACAEAPQAEPVRSTVVTDPDKIRTLWENMAP